MLNQIKYSGRQGLSLRLTALAIAVILNTAFAVLGMTNLYGSGGKITATVLSSLAFCGLLVVVVISDTQSVRSLFSAPAGYNTFLTPIPGWKILLGRIIPIVVLDLITCLIGVTGVTLQSFILANADMVLKLSTVSNGDSGFVWLFLIGIVNYLLCITAIFFGFALSKSVFFTMKGRGFLGFIGLIAVMYVLSWMDIALAAVTPVIRQGFFFTILINAGLNAGMIGYLAIGLAKFMILLFATAYLMDRRINL